MSQSVAAPHTMVTLRVCVFYPPSVQVCSQWRDSPIHYSIVNLSIPTKHSQQGGIIFFKRVMVNINKLHLWATLYHSTGDTMDGDLLKLFGCVFSFWSIRYFVKTFARHKLHWLHNKILIIKIVHRLCNFKMSERGREARNVQHHSAF